MLLVGLQLVEVVVDSGHLQRCHDVIAQHAQQMRPETEPERPPKGSRDRRPAWERPTRWSRGRRPDCCALHRDQIQVTPGGQNGLPASSEAGDPPAARCTVTKSHHSRPTSRSEYPATRDKSVLDHPTAQLAWYFSGVPTNSCGQIWYDETGTGGQ